MEPTGSRRGSDCDASSTGSGPAPDRDEVIAEVEQIASHIEKTERVVSFPERVGSLRTKLLEYLFAGGISVTATYTRFTEEVKDRYEKLKEKVSAVKDKIMETASPRSSQTKGKGPGPLDISA